MQRRYEIFISSTYQDLKEERASIEKAILALRHFPVGMELFRSGRVPPWEIISRAIDRCDYYVVVLANMYGTLVRGEDWSYTEKEYRYALSKKKPIMAFVISEEGSRNWPSGRTEQDETKRMKLKAFKESLREEYVQEWDHARDLDAKCREVLTTFLQENRAIGWIRANQLGDRFNRLKEENRELRKELEGMRLHDDVMIYLLKVLDPHNRKSIIAAAEIIALDTVFCGIDSVLKSLETLLVKFVKKRIPENMRVYFAYKLTGPFKRRSRGNKSILSDQRGITPVYRIAVSSSNESGWGSGTYAGRNSNIDYVYTHGEPNGIDDTDFSFGKKNQLVKDERSVIAIPARVGLSPVGVIGLSSPLPDGIKVIERFAYILESIFGCIIYAYGTQLEKQGLTHEQVVERMRDEICQHYEEGFKASVHASPVEPARVKGALQAS
jgi:hypothetical protein